MKNPLVIVVVVVVLFASAYFLLKTDDVVQEETQNTPAALDESQEQPSAQGKINIAAVCEGALAYMTFPDGESANAFVAECIQGEHPEVIERYKADLNLGADIVI